MLDWTKLNIDLTMAQKGLGKQKNTEKQNFKTRGGFAKMSSEPMKRIGRGYSGRMRKSGLAKLLKRETQYFTTFLESLEQHLQHLVEVFLALLLQVGI